MGKTIGEILKARRTRLGMTLRDAASEMSVGFNRAESNENCLSMETFVALAIWCGLPKSRWPAVMVSTLEAQPEDRRKLPPRDALDSCRSTMPDIREGE